MDFSNIPFLTRLSSIVQILAIVLIFLGGLLQASRFYLDKKISDFKERQSKIERERADSTIGELRSTVSSQAQKIEEQTRQVENQRKTIEQQSKEVQAQQQAIHEVEAKTRPRTISDAKFNELKSELSRHAGEKIEITCIIGDTEAMSLATRIKSLFQSSGWTVGGVNQAVYTQPIKGIVITIKDESAKDKAEYIFKVLGLADLKSVGEINPDIKFDVGLVIGAK